MKQILFFISVASLFVLASCDKHDSPGNNYDLSNSLPPYVALSSTASKTVHEGNTVNFTFQMRTAMQQTVTVYYDVTGDVNLTNQTVVIDRDKTSAVASVAIPANTIVPPNTSATATLTLVKAVAADGTQLTIGQKNTPATQKVAINIVP